MCVAAGTLAKLGKADMAVLAQLQAGGNQHAVNIHTGLTLELEEHVDGAGSFAPRLRTQPPQPRMAPVRVWTRREGSSMEIAFICNAQGILIVRSAFKVGTVSLTSALSEPSCAA